MPKPSNTVKKLKKNVLCKMNSINVATDNIGHEVIKKPKPSQVGKTRANVYGMKFINVAKTNKDAR